MHSSGNYFGLFVENIEGKNAVKDICLLKGFSMQHGRFKEIVKTRKCRCYVNIKMSNARL